MSSPTYSINKNKIRLWKSLYETIDSILNIKLTTPAHPDLHSGILPEAEFLMLLKDLLMLLEFFFAPEVFLYVAWTFLNVARFYLEVSWNFLDVSRVFFTLIELFSILLEFYFIFCLHAMTAWVFLNVASFSSCLCNFSSCCSISHQFCSKFLDVP